MFDAYDGPIFRKSQLLHPLRTALPFWGQMTCVMYSAAIKESIRCRVLHNAEGSFLSLSYVSYWYSHRTNVPNPKTCDRYTYRSYIYIFFFFLWVERKDRFLCLPYYIMQRSLHFRPDRYLYSGCLRRRNGGGNSTRVVWRFNPPSLVVQHTRTSTIFF